MSTIDPDTTDALDAEAQGRGLGFVDAPVGRLASRANRGESLFMVGAEVVYADHQNKVNVGSVIVRNWFDSKGVDMVIAGPNSAVGLAVSYIAREKNKVCMGTTPTCCPNRLLRKFTRSGSKTWCFISREHVRHLAAGRDHRLRHRGGRPGCHFSLSVAGGDAGRKQETLGLSQRGVDVGA